MATAAAIDRCYLPDPIPSGLLDMPLAFFAQRPDVLETMAALASEIHARR